MKKETNELDFFDFDETDFSFDDSAFSVDSRYIKPPLQKKLNFNQIKFSHAKKLVEQIDFNTLDRFYCRVNGSFIFTDFIQSFISHNNIQCKEMTIETLSLSADNVVSLASLIEKNYILKLHLIVSDYFYSHERWNVIKLIYELLDKDDKFQLSVCRTHCKICQFETLEGKKIVMHGSANLRSSDTFEQFTIEDNSQIYDFNKEYHEKIETKFKTIIK